MQNPAEVHVLQGALLPEGPSLMEVAVDRSGVCETLAPGQTVAVKSCFMRGVRHDDRAAVVDPALAQVLRTRLEAVGARVVWIEQPNGWEAVLEGREPERVAAYFGFEGEVGGVAEWEAADRRIVFGKLCSDPVSEFEGCVAALKGLEAPADHAFLDAFRDVADGPVGALGSAWPATPLRLYSGPTAEAVDAAVKRDLDGERGVPIEDWRGPAHSRFSRAVARLAPLGRRLPLACIVPPADPVVFPRRGAPTAVERLAHHGLRWILGWRPL